VHEFRAIDLALLRRNGVRDLGHAGSLTWSSQGAETGSVGWAIEPSGVRLRYACKSYDSDAVEEVDELICVVTTPTRFGGRRHWFACPSCHRRCRIVYGGTRFRCRLCWGATYTSQYEPTFWRLCDRRWRIRKQLAERGSPTWRAGLEDGFPPKPPRMHWRTYERLEALDQQLARRWAKDVYRRLPRPSNA
jgi:hypothetical protein